MGPPEKQHSNDNTHLFSKLHFEDDLKKRGAENEEDESDSNSKFSLWSDSDEDKLIIDEDLGDANDGYEIMTFLPFSVEKLNSFAHNLYWQMFGQWTPLG